MLKLRNQRSCGQCRGEGQTRPSGEIQQVSGRRQLSRNILAQFSLVPSQANILPAVVLGVANILPAVVLGVANILPGVVLGVANILPAVVLGVANILPVVCSCSLCPLVVSGYGDVKLLKLKLWDSTG